MELVVGFVILLVITALLTWWNLNLQADADEPFDPQRPDPRVYWDELGR
jgi:hypothetical protein